MDKPSYKGTLSKTLCLEAENKKESFENIIVKSPDLYNYKPDYNKGFSYSVQDKIPVSKLSRFYNDSQSDTTLRDFVDSISACDCTIEALCNMNNVIFVGTNSNGALLVRDPTDYKLKNSSICVTMGNDLYLTPLGDSFEGRGAKPDLLINSKDALDSTMKLIKYYKLNDK